MYTGGPTYTPQAARLVRFAGLVVPFVLFIYGLLVQYNLVETYRSLSSVGMNIPVFYGIMVSWFILSVVQYLRPSKTAIESMLRLLAYHFFAAVYLLLVTGIATPIVAFWIVLLIASSIYFGKNGLLLSVFWFICLTLIDVFFFSANDPTLISYNVLTLIAVSLSGLVAMSLSTSQEADQEALEQSKKQETIQRDRILTIVNNLTDAIMSTDINGVIRMYNAASLNLLDTNESLNGQQIDKILKLVDQDDKPVLMSKEFGKSASTKTRDDLNFTFSDGEEIRLEVTYSPIKSTFSRNKHAEGQEGYIIIMRDITKAKSLEEERDEFISVVSHELRTPITIVEGTLSNLQLMLEKNKKVDLKPNVDMAHDQTLYLAKMVNDLSTLSRAERGVADTPETISVGDLVKTMHERYSDEASAKSLHFDLDASPKLGQIHVSRLYVEELLQNFITNAIKYTKKGTVTLITTQNDKEVTFTVKDTGIGISKTDQAKVFEKFYRSEDYRTRETNGTGLGLYVAAKLSHKLHTHITLTSRLNHGSAFSFSLPLVPSTDKTV
ncbi:MAG: putative Multi-sensor signal transduction histidine kinase [Candidatus Saccharibacteria bacterium]|nr:putative Multi-sensor signal transduction histidine kinase [Candidatus Saccharibacteria bacterium]